MKITPLEIPALLLIEPSVFEDERGYFFESFNSEAFHQASGLKFNFVQDNESMSHRNVLRGLHFQMPPHAQGKLVRVVKGAVFDVAVDIRPASPHYGKWCGVLLSESNKKQLYIPPGFAHGFAVLENDTIFSYKCTAFYHKSSEICIRWDDPTLNIEWPVEDAIVSPKDLNEAVKFDTFDSPF
jgi:dTDP-4-dehydrorhamnose 3,5-epimerase